MRLEVFTVVSVDAGSVGCCAILMNVLPHLQRRDNFTVTTFNTLIILCCQKIIIFQIIVLNSKI
jgi:hypothetical protein